MPTIDERFNLRGKVAVVAGGAGYLGATLAQAMAASGMQVIILDAAEAADDAQPIQGSLTRLQGDVTSKTDLLRCRDAVLRSHRRVDVLLNAAGTNAPTPFAGVFNLTQNLSREWGSLGVRVNALRPGFFPTEWSMQHFIDEERKAKILSHTPMGRFGNPEELIGAVLWLASDAASFVTGSLITIDGGFSAMTI